METVISNDGTRIAFDRYGTGPPIVLVGGAFQYRAFDPRTAKLAELMSSDFTVSHYDRRGRGDGVARPRRRRLAHPADLEHHRLNVMRTRTTHTFDAAATPARRVYQEVQPFGSWSVRFDRHRRPRGEYASGSVIEMVQHVARASPGAGCC
jgi:hypothetical protein